MMMTRRSYQYFKAKKIYKVIVRPIEMLERQHYGAPEWISEFNLAWERSLVSVNHLGNNLKSMHFASSYAQSSIDSIKQMLEKLKKEGGEGLANENNL
jgi:hypothetical protein